MNNLSFDLIFKLSLFVILLVFMFRSRRRFKRMRNEEGRMPAVVDERQPSQRIETSTKFERTVEGTAYQCEVHPQTEEIAAYLVVTIIQKTNGDFSIGKTQEGAQPGWLKRWAITHVQTEDESFNADFDVITDRTPAFATESLRSATARDAVRKLFGMGVQLIRNDGLGIDLIWPDYCSDMAIETVIDSAAIELRKLTDCCLEAPEHQRRWLIREKWHIQTAVAVPFLAVFSNFLVIALSAITGTSARAVDESITHWWFEVLVSLPFIALWIIILYWMLKGRSNSAALLLTLWITSGIAMFFSCSMWIFTLNAQLDSSPGTSIVQPIVDFRQTYSGYDIDVLFWHSDRPFKRIFVSNADYAQDRLAFMRCDSLVIETKPGYFGYEWISSVKPAEGMPVPEQP
jgi:hypothetical protein